MKQFVLRCLLTCIYLCVLCWTSDAQSPAPADSHFLAGNFEEAAVKYEPQYFMAPDVTASAYALLQKSRSYKNLEQFDKALLNLNRIPVYSIPDSLAAEVQYEIVLNSYLSGDLSKTEFLLAQYRQTNAGKNTLARMLMMEVLTFNKQNKYDAARQSFSELMVLQQRQLNADSVFTGRPKLKNPKKAEILSAIIPGSGQIYAGYPGEGITSFVLQTAALGFGAYHIYKSYYLIGFFTGFGTFQRFYFGGMSRASYLANLKNKERNNKFNSELFRLMQSN